FGCQQVALCLVRAAVAEHRSEELNCLSIGRGVTGLLAVSRFDQNVEMTAFGVGYHTQGVLPKNVPLLVRRGDELVELLDLPRADDIGLRLRSDRRAEHRSQYRHRKYKLRHPRERSNHGGSPEQLRRIAPERDEVSPAFADWPVTQVTLGRWLKVRVVLPP